jgi:hypothetical protein
MQNWFTSPTHLDLSTLARLAHADPCAYFYCPEYLYKAAEAGELDCLNIVADICAQKGYRPVLLNDPREWVDDLLATEKHLHILIKDEPRQPAKNVFYCVPSYLKGYWYFDRVGVRNNSSTRDAQFDANVIDDTRAAKFHANIHTHFIDLNVSKFVQADLDATALPDNAIFIASQKFLPIEYCPYYIDFPTLIAGTIKHRGDRPVVIKPHPMQKPNELEIINTFHDPDNGVHVINASIHAILAKTDVVITQSSAVAFEAMIHRVPSVLAGPADFHHILTTIKDASELPTAIQQAINSTPPYSAYLFWFLRERMIKPAQENNASNRIKRVFRMARKNG